MTCCVAIRREDNRVLLAGDSFSGNEDTYDLTSIPKVWVKRGVGFAVAGGADACVALYYKLQLPQVRGADPGEWLCTRLAPRMQELVGMDKDSSGFEAVVAYKGHFLTVSSAKDTIDLISRRYAAVGCGSPIAIGALYALDGSDFDTLRVAKIAIEAAAAHCAQVKGPITHVII